MGKIIKLRMFKHKNAKKSDDKYKDIEQYKVMDWLYIVRRVLLLLYIYSNILLYS